MIIGIIILLACFLPLILVYIFRKRNEKALLRNLFDIAKGKNCSINQWDLWSNTAIGLDEEKHILFFIRNTNDNLTQEINLSNVTKCKVVSINSSYSEKGEKDAVGKLELALFSNDKMKSEIRLEFYNTKHDNLTLNGELQLVEKWEKIVEKEIQVGMKK